MKTLTKETIDGLTKNIEEIFFSYSPKILDLLEKEKSTILLDSNNVTTRCYEMIPMGFTVTTQIHSSKEERGYINCKIKLLTENEIVERTLIQLSYYLGNPSWISPATSFNKIVTGIKFRKKRDILFEKMYREIDEFIKNSIKTIY